MRPPTRWERLCWLPGNIADSYRHYRRAVALGRAHAALRAIRREILGREP